MAQAAHPRAAGAGRAAGAPAAVLAALGEAARRTGADFDTLFRIARLESGFRPAARASTSSAEGLFQFIEQTWLSTLGRFGAAHGLSAASRAEALALRRDPLAAALLAGEHLADNGRKLAARLGRAVEPVELYLAHFLGPAGAGQFLETLARAPQTLAARLNPAAARANRAIFEGPGGPRTVAEVHALIRARFESGPAPPSGADGPRSATAAGRPPALARPAAVEAAGATADRLSPTAVRAAAQAAYLLLADLGA